MKKIILSLLVVAMCCISPVSALAQDGSESQISGSTPYLDTSYLDAMKTIAKSETLTENCIAIPAELYQSMTFVMETTSSTDIKGLICYAFTYQGNTLVQPFNKNKKEPISVYTFSSSNIAQFDSKISSITTVNGYAPKVLFDLLSPLTEDVQITIKMYSTESYSGTPDTNGTPKLNVTYTFKAPEKQPAPEVNYMDLSATDVNDILSGTQVYAGDTVTVNFTNKSTWNENAQSTNYALKYNASVFELQSELGASLTKSDGGGRITGTAEAFSQAQIQFKALAQNSDSVNGNFSFAEASISDGSSLDSDTAIVMLKPIVYSVIGGTEVDVSGNTKAIRVSKTYNKQPQTIEIEVSDPAEGAAVTYAENRNGSAEEYTQTAPTITNRESKDILFQISAKGYAQAGGIVYFAVVTVPLTITPKDTTIYVGDALPTSFDYTVEGLCEGDELTTAPTFSVDGTVDTTKTGTYTIKAQGADAGNNYKIAYKNATLTVASRSGGKSSGSKSSSSSGTTTKTDTTTNKDGSTTTTETKSDGTKVETTTNTDGSTTTTETKTETKTDGSSVTTEVKTETKTDGTKTEVTSEVTTAKDGTTTRTETAKTTDSSGSTGTTTTVTNASGATTVTAEATVSEKAVEMAQKENKAITVPVEVKATTDVKTAPTVEIKIEVKSSGSTDKANTVKVEVPVTNVDSGTVAVIVKADGTEEIIKTTVPTENGVAISVEGNVTIKVVDNSKSFEDTTSHWSKDEVNFVASREIFNGVGNNIFGVSEPMTRGMVNTVLARLAGEDTNGGENWYDKGNEWAVKNGVSDGTNPTDSVTREQLATMLYRYAGSPEVSGDINFADSSAISEYAQKALLWATQNGIINGMGDGTIAPSAEAERAQVAAMMARFLKNL